MKCNDRRGFTLVEMLCVIVVVLLVSAAMVTGVSLAVRSYAKSVSFSEAQVLCSTLKTTVSDELRYAGTVQEENGTIGFFSRNYGQKSMTGFTVNEDGQVLLAGQKLLPAKAYPYGLRASVDLTSYDSQTRTFCVSIHVTNKDGGIVAQTDFEVQKLNTSAEEITDETP